MKIILAPAKKMRFDDTLAYRQLPVFLSQSEQLLTYLKSLNHSQLKQLWKTNDKITAQMMDTLSYQHLSGDLTPAILAYDGIAYQYMAPNVFTDEQFAYLEEHLRIISGLYGVLRPSDGIIQYRLEMQAKVNVAGCHDLYHYWSDQIYQQVKEDIILNLASQEYSKPVEDYLQKEDHFITCIFGQIEKEKVIQKGVYAKMARGEMVRYLAEHQVTDLNQIQAFDRQGYHFDKERSDESHYVFIKE